MIQETVFRRVIPTTEEKNWTFPTRSGKIHQPGNCTNSFHHAIL